MLLALAFFIALTWSTTLSLGRGGDSTSRILARMALAALTSALFFTTRYWAKWLLGIVGLVSARALIGTPFFLLSGKTDVAKQLAFIFVYCLIAALLTWRHYQREPAGTERPGLVAFVVCASFAMALHSYVLLLAGLALLGVGELTQRILRSKRRRFKGHRDSPMPIV
jgi:hypothetical protein